jgi:dTDP-4-dehydrorhamnose reductase
MTKPTPTRPSGLYDSTLITGGRGMLARAFSQVLSQRGMRATAVGRPECDVADANAVAATFERVKPTLLINCAAYTKVDLAEKETEAAHVANGFAPGVLAEACRRHGTALVQFSTDYVFDGSIRRPLRPDDPVGPQGVYGKSKLEGERAIQANPPARWMIVRTAWLYGPGGPNFVQTMLNVARAGKPLRVVNDQRGSPTYTFDLAAATLDLLDRGASGVWHVTNAGETSWFDFARAIFDEWGLSPDLQPTTSSQWKATKPDSATRPAYSVFDIEPIRHLLGRPMRPWQDALRAYHQSAPA